MIQQNRDWELDNLKLGTRNPEPESLARGTGERWEVGKRRDAPLYKCFFGPRYRNLNLVFSPREQTLERGIRTAMVLIEPLFERPFDPPRWDQLWCDSPRQSSPDIQKIIPQRQFATAALPTIQSTRYIATQNSYAQYRKMKSSGEIVKCEKARAKTEGWNGRWKIEKGMM